MGKGILLLVLYIDLGMLLVPENAEDFAAGRNPLLTVFLESAELDQFQLTPEGRPIQKLCATVLSTAFMTQVLFQSSRGRPCDFAERH